MLKKKVILDHDNNQVIKNLDFYPETLSIDDSGPQEENIWTPPI